MGLVHWLCALVEMPAKRAFLVSMGFRMTKGEIWVSDINGDRVYGRDVRRWTLAELKKYYTHYKF